MKLTKAKVNLLLNSPFFATLLLNLEMVETEGINTMECNGKTLSINPKFFESLPVKYHETALAHVIMHPVLLHHTRMGHRDKNKWHMAADIAVNLILKGSGFTIPPDWPMVDKFEELEAEEIYKRLKDMPESKLPPPPPMIDIVPPDNSEDDCVKDEEEQQQVKRLIMAYTVARQAGKEPAGMKRIIDDLLDPKVDWRTELIRMVSEKTYDDYKWNQPNRRYISMGVYLPILQDESIGNIVLVADTSGSIGQAQLNVFSSECNDIGNIAKSKKWVLYCDTKIAHHEEYDEGDDIHMKPHGGGGTSFSPPFHWVERNNIDPKILIYFTDGYSNDFAPPPDYPVIWAVYQGDKRFTPPYGSVIHIDDLSN